MTGVAIGVVPGVSIEWTFSCLNRPKYGGSLTCAPTTPWSSEGDW
jgi:hypothetical protein